MIRECAYRFLHAIYIGWVRSRRHVLLNRWDVFLGVLSFCVFLSAFLVVYSRNVHHQLFQKEQRLLSVQRQLQVEWTQLLLEEGALSNASRISHIASQKWGMLLPSQQRTVLVYLPQRSSLL